MPCELQNVAERRALSADARAVTCQFEDPADLHASWAMVQYDWGVPRDLHPGASPLARPVSWLVDATSAVARGLARYMRRLVHAGTRRSQ